MQIVKVKRRTFEIIQAANEHDTASRVFDLSVILLIVLNTILVVLDTFNLPAGFIVFSSVIETFSVLVFSIEYLLRIWTADLLFPDKTAFRARVRYVCSFMAVIDLLSILPFYIPFIIPIDLRVLRTLRLIRLLRLFKVNRYTNALSSIGRVFKSRASQLVSSMLVISLLMVIASVVMYNVENPAQPDVFQNAFSGLWWAIATLTTVGYGDIYPVTGLGKILSALIALLGIGLVAVPTGIISAGFMEQLDQPGHDDPIHYCPYCGKRID